METKPKILLVDDDPIIERVYTELLQESGFEVEYAPTADEAIAKIKASPPDAVLLDLFLPKVNGVEVLKFIRSQPATRELPVVAFSTSSTSRHVEAAWREGLTKFFAKDQFKAAEIVAEVGKMAEAAKAAPKDSALAELGLDAGSERQKAFESFPVLKTELRDRWVALANSEKDGRVGKIDEILQTAQTLVSQATAAEVGIMLQAFVPLEAFFKDLKLNPATISLSALRSGVQAVDFAGVLCDYAARLAREPLVPGLILIASDRIGSGDVFLAMKRTNLTVVSVRELDVALPICEANRFQMIFWDADMPGPSRSDILKRIRALPTNQATPVIFIIKTEGFDNQAREAAGGGFDVIARPIAPPEFAIKAVSGIVRDRMSTLSD